MKSFSHIFLSFLIISFVLISCTQNKSSITRPKAVSTYTATNQLLTFDLKRMPDISTTKLSEIGTIEIAYLPLKTTKETVIPQIKNIIFSKNYFLTISSSCIYMFQYNGTFVSEIGTNGRGPNEYLFAHDVAVDPMNESIYIGDGRQSKFLVIDKTGKVLRTFESPQKGLTGFKFIKDGILCYYDNHGGNIENSYILIDTIGKIIENYPNKYPLEGSGMSYECENIFYTFNNQIFKKEIYCDTIFQYNNKVFEPHLIIDVGSLSLTPNVRTNANGGSFSEIKSTLSKILLPSNLFEFSDFIYYQFGTSINGKYDVFSFIGSKKNNFKAIFPVNEGLVNDIDGGPNIKLRGVRNNNTIVSWIDAFEFKKYIASDTFINSTPEFPEKKKELEKLAKDIMGTDNPVLMLVKIK